MIRFFRRLWVRWNHRHEWEVIFQSKINTVDTGGDPMYSESFTIERCTCSLERARKWDSFFGRWEPLDMDWLNMKLREQNISIPARHQE